MFSWLFLLRLHNTLITLRNWNPEGFW
jgi:hypothetical protein